MSRSMPITDHDGSKRQETGNRKQETRDRKQETGNRKQETIDKNALYLVPCFLIPVS